VIAVAFVHARVSTLGRSNHTDSNLNQWVIVEFRLQLSTVSDVEGRLEADLTAPKGRKWRSWPDLALRTVLGAGPSTAEQGRSQKSLATAAVGFRHRMPYLESEKVRFIFDREQK